ncbi:flagellar basal-body MS-ring/collar protein FliF [Alkalibacterium olivapovliticus]|uniref:Flagellar M-ring protein n=1 Tax=Alkalibacterium olivapovliticus TaxID=99907 RepID=A0A2T0VZ83_9LACT|nr:flagellar basal-body MS-ring/collar protein FliF [Alkalibacterium olivapovliticus]PRY77500.1 flagellar M-ring protein FliF [Alkalibacterium olivapovliticus]
MNKVKDIGTSIKDGWLQLESKKRKRLVILVAIALILLGSIGYFTQRSQYTVLFSNLEEADAGTIVEDLNAQNMKYQLEDNGTTILVEEKDVDNYRISLAVNGMMPEKSTGFEIFDDTNMMTTDDDRQIMYQRALTGELERSISSLQQIDAAKVMLSLPEDSIFQNPAYRSESSASIVVETRGVVSQQNIQGIASLVTGAVENLPMENVQIVDTTGNLLSGFLQSGGEGMASADFSSNQQNIKRSYEKDLEERIMSLLAPVYGYNNLRVVVNASMNFDVIEGETVEYSAPMTEEGDENRTGLIRSQTESFDGARDMLAGLIEDGDFPLVDEEEDENNASLDRTINYELDQVTERYVRAPGVVEGVNASVVVNQNAGVVPVQDQVGRIISRALGLDGQAEVPLSGDVTVEIMPFAEGEDFAIGGGDGIMDEILEFLTSSWLFMVIGLVLVIIAIAVLTLLKRGKETSSAEDAAAQAALNPQPVIMPEPDPIEQIDKQNDAMQQKNKVMSEKEDRVRTQAKENPELAAELMKVWLKD